MLEIFVVYDGFCFVRIAISGRILEKNRSAVISVAKHLL